ncbi:MAG TPA: hypothetical protein VJ256_02735 [Dehalococcoidia bacterium]|nr:hypothetical protein [Dehalococcoidia bacterium]
MKKMLVALFLLSSAMAYGLGGRGSSQSDLPLEDGHGLASVQCPSDDGLDVVAILWMNDQFGVMTSGELVEGCE